MIHHNLVMLKGEFVWERFFVLWPRIITTSRTNQDGHAQVFETFVWLEYIERRLDKKLMDNWAGGEAFEYRLLENQKP